MSPEERARTGWRYRLHEIIFEADTAAGKGFDVLLLLAIILSVISVVLESVTEIRVRHGGMLRAFEWGFTILFTVEYVLRILLVRRPLRYVTSFFGLVDLLAVVPTYLSLIFVGTQSLLVIRVLRLLRIFRILKLAQFVRESNMLLQSLRASARKILVFLGTVLTLVLILGTAMYLLEGDGSGFTSIPRGVYWAIVTMTTVGYGDIVPRSAAGRTLAAFVMILGYAIIAVPTGIVSAEMAATRWRTVSTQACPDCSAEGHDPDAKHCKHCGARL